MKSKEELNALKGDIELLGNKLAELTEDELKEISGGTFSHDDLPRKNEDEKFVMSFNLPDQKRQYEFHFYSASIENKDFIG